MNYKTIIHIGITLMMLISFSGCGLSLRTMEAITGDDYGADERQEYYKKKYNIE